MRVFACLPSQSFASQMPALPRGELRSRSEPHTCRIRQSLAQTCSRAAPSVTACAVPPSSKRKALLTRRPNLSLPLGEMSRSDREGRRPCEGAGLPPCGKTEGVCQIGKIRMRFALRCACLRVCPLSHFFANASSPEGRAKKAQRTAHMPHQAISCAGLLACCSFRHGLRRATFLKEEGFVYAQTKLVSPSGRDVAQRQRGPAPFVFLSR